jgi:glutathione reductase (NADPH)
MAARKFDVLILGGGNAGMGVTVDTRAAGLSVALVEDRDLGGTCPNRGCVPKKVLVAAGHALHEIEQAKTHCIAAGKPSLDWGGLIRREKELIRPLPASFARTMADRGVEVLRGKAVFAGPNAVQVAGERIEAAHIVVATGSVPRKLPIEGAEHMITSDEVLSEEEQPGSVVFVGGGVIAFEFSHVYARAGTKVTILEALPRLLGQMDADAVDRLRTESERIGITINTGVKVQRIARTGSRLRVTYEVDGRAHTVDADRVVNGAGRVPNTEDLNLAAGNIENDRGRIAVDRHLRSKTNPAVYVAGDPLASPQLSPVATYEGRIVGRNIVEGPKHAPDYSSIPSCVFTVPALASVGLTEAAARDEGLKITVKTSEMTAWLTARTYAESAAWAKIIVEQGSERILGAHIFGHAGEDLINFFALAMGHGIKANALREMVYAYPTFSNDIKSML